MRSRSFFDFIGLLPTNLPGDALPQSFGRRLFSSGLAGRSQVATVLGRQYGKTLATPRSPGRFGLPLLFRVPMAPDDGNSWAPRYDEQVACIGHSAPPRYQRKRRERMAWVFRVHVQTHIVVIASELWAGQFNGTGTLIIDNRGHNSRHPLSHLAEWTINKPAKTHQVSATKSHLHPQLRK